MEKRQGNEIKACKMKFTEKLKDAHNQIIETTM